MSEHRDVVVVGGGQAGLAVGYCLAQQNGRFTILEAARQPAAAWRERWDSLRLFTPVRRDSLPGRAFPGDPDSYPTRDEVVAYLEDYARHFELPVELNSRVLAVRAGDGGFEVELADRRYAADQVVIATGPWQVPFTPPMASGLAPEVMQLHSTGYRRPEQLPDGPVVVVGGGNTGYQIAEELVRSREVHLAVGARQTPLPQRLLGRDVFDYLERMGLMRKTVDSRLAQRLKDRETLVGSSPRRARKQGIRLRPRVIGAEGPRCTSPTARSSGQRGHLGDGLSTRPLVRAPARLRRRRPRRAPSRRHQRAGPVLPRFAVASHARIGAAGLDSRRRGYIAERIAQRAATTPSAAGTPPRPSSSRASARAPATSRSAARRRQHERPADSSGPARRPPPTLASRPPPPTGGARARGWCPTSPGRTGRSGGPPPRPVASGRGLPDDASPPPGDTSRGRPPLKSPATRNGAGTIHSREDTWGLPQRRARTK